MGRRVPLRVWGLAGTVAMLKHLEEAYAFDVHVRRDVDEQLSAHGIVLTGKDIAEGVVYEKWRRKSHGVSGRPWAGEAGTGIPHRLPGTLGQGHSVVLSGDTRPSNNLVKFARGTDVLVHEVFDADAYHEVNNSLTPEQRQRVREHHTTPEEAGRIFTKVAPKLAVYSHIVPPDVPDVVPHAQGLRGAVGGRGVFDGHRDWGAGAGTAIGALSFHESDFSPFNGV